MEFDKHGPTLSTTTLKSADIPSSCSFTVKDFQVVYIEYPNYDLINFRALRESCFL